MEVRPCKGRDRTLVLTSQSKSETAKFGGAMVVRLGSGTMKPGVPQHTYLTWGFVFSYPNLSQVRSFFDVRCGEILGQLLGRRAQIMTPRHAWQLVPHEQFEGVVSDAPLELREGAP